jgi:hypothetical protein
MYPSTCFLLACIFEDVVRMYGLLENIQFKLGLTELVCENVNFVNTIGSNIYKHF